MLNNLCIIILLIIASCSKPLSELSNLYSKNGSYFQSGGIPRLVALLSQVMNQGRQ